MEIGLVFFPKIWHYCISGILREIMSDSETVKITIKFFAGLREYGPVKEEIEIPTTSDLSYIIEKYNIPMSKKKIIILINGIPQDNKDFKFKDGDIVAIFPPIAGG